MTSLGNGSYALSLAVIALFALGVLVAVRIARQAGYSPWWAVLAVLLPIVGIVLLLYFAFARWPVSRRLESYQRSQPGCLNDGYASRAAPTWTANERGYPPPGESPSDPWGRYPSPIAQAPPPWEPQPPPPWEKQPPPPWEKPPVRDSERVDEPAAKPWPAPSGKPAQPDSPRPRAADPARPATGASSGNWPMTSH
jgi:hypothetical protein